MERVDHLLDFELEVIIIVKSKDDVNNNFAWTRSNKAAHQCIWCILHGSGTYLWGFDRQLLFTF